MDISDLGLDLRLNSPRAGHPRHSTVLPKTRERMKSSGNPTSGWIIFQKSGRTTPPWRVAPPDPPSNSSDIPIRVNPPNPDTTVSQTFSACLVLGNRSRPEYRSTSNRRRIRRFLRIACVVKTNPLFTQRIFTRQTFTGRRVDDCSPTILLCRLEACCLHW